MTRESDLELLKTRLQNYDIKLANHNAKYRIEGLSDAVKASGDQLDQDACAITEMVAKMTGDLIKDLNDAGVRLQEVTISSNDPSHSVFMNAGSLWAAKKVAIPGFEYARGGGSS